ncbi:hypothetical protein VTI74DRAFT_3656 [Chaetomium olivicolor]
MENFRKAVAALLDCLWGSALATDAGQAGLKEEFIQLLIQTQHFIVARKVGSKKPLDKAIDKQDIQSASNFFNQINKEQGPKAKKEEWKKKRACLQRLDDRALGILAVLCTADDISKYSVETVEALAEGAQRIATWSDWPNDPELARVVQQKRPPHIASGIVAEVRQPASSSALTVIGPGECNTAVTAQPTRFDPSQEARLLFRCSCGEQATDGGSPTAITTTPPASNPRGAASINAVATLAHTASINRSTQSFRNTLANAPPPPTTTRCAAAADAAPTEARSLDIGTAASEPGPATDGTHTNGSAIEDNVEDVTHGLAQLDHASGQALDDDRRQRFRRWDITIRDGQQDIDEQQKGMDPTEHAPSTVASQASYFRTASLQPNEPRLAQPPRSQPYGTEHQSLYAGPVDLPATQFVSVFTSQPTAPRRRRSVSSTPEEPPQKRQNVADREHCEGAFESMPIQKTPR